MEMNKATTLCITGHRPSKLPWGYNEDADIPKLKSFVTQLKAIVIEQIENGYTHFITGMALGVDQIFAKVVIELKQQYKDIKLIAAIPCKTQSSVWPAKSQASYNKILENCDEKHVLSENYTSTCLNDRNRWMVERSSTVIACWDGSTGGTENAVRLAKEYNAKIIRINPKCLWGETEYGNLDKKFKN